MIMDDEEPYDYTIADNEEQRDIEEEKKHGELEWWFLVVVLLAVIGCITIVRHVLGCGRRRHRAARPAELYPGATPKKRGKAIIDDIDRFR